MKFFTDSEFRAGGLCWKNKLFSAFAIFGFVFFCGFVTTPTLAANQILRPQVAIGNENLQLVQSADASFRVNQLEEQIRQLNGKIEELNFQILQMQEQMRRMQEDNEFRFQELEEKRGSLGNREQSVARSNNDKGERLGKSKASEQATLTFSDVNREQIQPKENQANSELKTIDGVEIFDPTKHESADSGSDNALGTITFDHLGNVVDSAVGKPLDLTASLNNQTSASDVVPGNSYAAIEDPQVLYDTGYDLFQSGDYANSQLAFETFSQNFPDHPKLSSAQYWLGESMFSQSNFEGAAKVFLNAQERWPDSRLAPQTLLKLGTSLAGMNQRELACATYAKVSSKYPEASNAVRERVKAEQRSARCISG